MRLLVRLAFPTILLATWQACALGGVIDTPPVSVVEALWRDIGSGRLLIDSAATLSRLLLGTIVGASLGIACGYALAFSQRLNDLFAPTLLVFSQFPPIVWTPFIIAVAGIGDFAKIELVGIAAFFIWFPAQLNAIREIDPRLVEVLRAYNVSGLKSVLHFYVPATVPSLGKALHLSIVFGWVILIAAELIGASTGLGWYVWDARNFGRTPEFLAGLLLTGAIGAVLTLLADAAIGHLTRWLPRAERV